MTDTTARLRQDLLDAIAADAASTRPSDSGVVRTLGRRRRAVGLTVAAAALAVATGVVASAALPARDTATLARPAQVGGTAPFLLDEGTSGSGPWTLVVTDERCIEHGFSNGSRAACPAGDGDDGSVENAFAFTTRDAGTPVVVVSGSLQDGAMRVTIRLADRAPVQAEAVLVDGRPYFAARTPADAHITGIDAVDAEGKVLARAGEILPES